MNLIKYDPFTNMVRRMENFWNIFDNRPAVNMYNPGFLPKVDISEDKGSFYVQAEIPGYPKDQVRVTLNDENLLTIKGEIKQEEKSEDKTYHRIERRFGSFERSFCLPENINKDNIDARFENGMLNIRIEKKEPEVPKEKEILLS